MYQMMQGEKERLIKRLGVYYRQHMSGQNRRKEMLAILVLLDRSGTKISKTAQKIQLSDIEKSAKGGIIKSQEVPGGRSDSHIPEDKVVYRKTEEGKTIAINSETGQVSGCGPEIDKQSEKSAKESNGELRDCQKSQETRSIVNVKKTIAPEFKAKFDEAKATQLPENAWRVDDTYTVSDYEHAKCLTTDGGSCVAVKPDGDIVSVCKNMNSTDRGSDLLKRAIENGGDRLDAFGEGLYIFYTKNGFEPVSWTPFNEEYAPHDWNSSRDAKEPVVFYCYTGKKIEMSFTDFIRNTPKSADYDEAKNFRDSKAGENK